MVRNRRVVWCLTFGATILGAIAPATVAQVRAGDRIVTNVELVQVPVVVFDDRGAVAANLGKNDFRVLDDGVEQRILYCDRERLPVSFVILADVSSSMTRKIPFVQEAALSLLDPPDEQGQDVDEFAILGVETRTKMILPFTRDEKDLQRRLPLLLEPTNGSTALFDGIHFGVAVAQNHAANEHRAVIIISDGGDNHSRYNLYETKQMLEEADVPVFAVMAGPSFELPPFLAPPRKSSRPRTSNGPGPQFPNLPSLGEDYIGPAERRGPHNLRTLTEASGGGVFTAGQPEDLARIVQTIGQAVRYRYVLSYKPLREEKLVNAREKVGGDTARHNVKLELYPKEKFRGYSLPYYKRTYRSFK
jgi:Ca-activated chloride channel homolog